jgi:pimeloyl-ACP methyl ester carboxylesterase
MQPTERRVTHGEIHLATEVRGEATNGTILLAMGATASMLWWPEALVAGLAAGGYQVIRFDHRDTGKSTTNAPGDVRYDVADLADDLVAILDDYHVPAAHVVGMSLGGLVSQFVALKHPERVATLTLIASEPLGTPYEGEGIAPGFMEHFATMGDLDWTDQDAVARFMLRIAELSAGPAHPFDPEAAMARIRAEQARTQSLQSAFNHSMIAGELDPGLTAAAITQPLLLIHGSDDPIISVAAARKTAQIVPAAELLVLEGVGHELPAEEIPRIVDAILKHCRQE